MKINVEGKFIKKDYAVSILVACLLFLLSQPYFIWTIPKICTFCSLVFFIILLPEFQIIGKKESLLNFLLLISYIFVVLKIINNENGNIFGLLLPIILFIPFLYVKKEIWVKIFECYAKIFAILIFFSIIEYILIYFFHISIHYTPIDASPFNDHSEFGTLFYKKFHFLVVEEMSYFIEFPRFSGYFDEPGVVGTIAMVLLYTNKYNLKKSYNVIIFIAGILSFSFFFYLATLIYIMFFSSMKVKIYSSVIIILLIALMWSNEFIQIKIINRFLTFFSKGEDAGLSMRLNDNLKYVYDNISFLDLFLGTSDKKIPFSTTYKYLVAVCGILPLTILSILVFIKAYNLLYLSKELYIYILIYILVLAQRPFITTSIYVFLIIVPMYVLYFSKKKTYAINI